MRSTIMNPLKCIARTRGYSSKLRSIQAASRGDDAFNFAIYSKHATAVRLLLLPTLAIDTARPAPDDIELDHPRELPHSSCIVEPHSTIVLVR